MFRAFAITGLRAGTITEDQIVEAAEYAESRGDTEAAHQLMCLILRANETPRAEFEAQKRRDQMRVIDGGAGD